MKVFGNIRMVLAGTSESCWESKTGTGDGDRTRMVIHRLILSQVFLVQKLEIGVLYGYFTLYFMIFDISSYTILYQTVLKGKKQDGKGAR